MNYIEKREENGFGQDHRIGFKTVALAMGIVSVVLGFIPKEADYKNCITLLGMGLAAPAIASLMKAKLKIPFLFDLRIRRGNRC